MRRRGPKIAFIRNQIFRTNVAIVATFVGLFGFGQNAPARVFNFSQENLAAYFRGTGGMSSAEQQAFSGALGRNTVSGKPAYTISGEFGVLLGLTPGLNLKLAAEVIQPQGVDEAKGTSSAGVQRFEMESEVFVFNPKASLEFLIPQSDSFRYMTYASLGMADVSIDNTFTRSSTSDLNVAPFTEKMQGSAFSSTLGFGLETLFTDNVTFFCDLGYRYLVFNSLEYKADVTTYQGSYQKGDKAKKLNGANRSLDLSGPYAAIGFRFYIDIID